MYSSNSDKDRKRGKELFMIIQYFNEELIATKVRYTKPHQYDRNAQFGKLMQTNILNQTRPRQSRLIYQNKQSNNLSSFSYLHLLEGGYYPNNGNSYYYIITGPLKVKEYLRSTISIKRKLKSMTSYTKARQTQY